MLSKLDVSECQLQRPTVPTIVIAEIVPLDERPGDLGGVLLAEFILNERFELLERYKGIIRRLFALVVRRSSQLRNSRILLVVHFLV